MNTSTTHDAPVRWKSLSGVGLVLLLTYGLINFGAAIAVPMALERGGGQGGGDGGVIIGRVQEEFMLGTTYARLAGENPKLDKLLVDSMVGMCSQMMALAVAYLGLAWFGARGGARWAPGVLLAAGVVYVPYYFIIARDLTAFGAPGAYGAAWMVSAFAIPAVLGGVLMMIGQRRHAIAG